MLMNIYTIELGHLIQFIACHLSSAKPLSEPMLIYFQLYTKKQNPVKFE